MTRAMHRIFISGLPDFATNLSRLPKSLLLLVLVLVSGSAVFAQSQLSSNSGINASDTYVVFDLSLQPQATIPLNQTIQVPNESGSMSQVNAAVPHPNYHVEVGFDTANQTVMNMTPTDPPDDPSQPAEASVGMIKLRNNQVSVYDGNGSVLPFMGMDTTQLPSAQLFPGNVPTSRSLTNTLIISDPQSMASSVGGTVISNDGTTAVISTQVQNGSGQLTYKAQNGMWVASQITTTTTTNNQTVNTSLLVNVTAWNSNPQADAQRAANSTPFPSQNNSGLVTPSYVGPLANAIVYPPFGSTGSQPLILQHGLTGSSASWGDRMEGWLQSDLNLGQIANYSLTSTDGIPSQADDLANRLAHDGQPASIGLGHSQGGLVLRSLMQRYPGSPLQALVTVETPNQGAWSATLALPAAIAISVLLTHNCFPPPTPLNLPVCGLGALPGTTQLINLGFSNGSGGPFGENTVDITPGSSFLGRINLGSESLRRLGLEAHSNKRWLWIRWTGDSVCANTTHTACGENYYDAAQAIYYFNVARFVVDVILGFFFDVDAALDAIWAAIDILEMESSDLIWDVATGAVGDTSDALVPGSSQHYPNPSDPAFVIGDADTHSGAMHSAKVRYALDQILQQRFLVPHSGCSYSLSAPSSMPFYGGSVPVTVATAPGCYWSALSSQGFVQEGAMISGSGTENVRMDINLGNQPRATVINVQGQTVTVLQSGMPLYTSQGSFSVQGFEQKVVFTGCYNPAVTRRTTSQMAQPNGHCPPNTYYDSGTVSLAVRNNSFDVTYSSSSTKQTVANDLIAAVNGSGYVWVGTLGSQLVIVSLNGSSGVNTDYALSATSASDEPDLFRHPSFSVVLPAPSMSGNP